METNRNGWLVPNGDHRMFAWAMVEAMADPARARAYGTNGRARIEMEFAAGLALESLEKLYMSLTD